jgi:hypothetical protein
VVFLTYMSHYTHRKRINIKDGHQIIHPDQLEVGMEIGVVTIIDPVSRKIRLAQAIAALAFPGYGRKPGESRLAAMKRGWQFKGPAGLLPDWQGTIEHIGDNGVLVDLRASRGETKKPFDYLNKGVEELPEITHPTRLHSTFEGMGLAAVTTANQTFGDEAGRWLPAATVRIS